MEKYLYRRGVLPVLRRANGTETSLLHGAAGLGRMSLPVLAILKLCYSSSYGLPS